MASLPDGRPPATETGGTQRLFDPATSAPVPSPARPTRYAARGGLGDAVLHPQ